MSAHSSRPVLPAARLSFDPESAQADPAFDEPRQRGSPVPAGRLTAEALRQRFAAPPPWQPETVTDGRLIHLDRPPRVAAVLIPVMVRPAGMSILLTERTAHLADHAGQISFPGGGAETSDCGPAATALREAHEEIGLQPQRVEVIGALPEYVTATSYRVTPVVGLVRQPVELRLDRFEVAHAFEVPLAFLMDPRNHERRVVQMAELRRTFYAIPYTAERRYFIWGATAAMLRNLYCLLRA
jgi:8-oxo-dGTP pyrophosphatase MutT (NUDIX family)